MTTSAFTAIDTNNLPWEERFNGKIGRALFRKELFSDPETGMAVRLVRYPAGVINPNHTDSWVTCGLQRHFRRAS